MTNDRTVVHPLDAFVSDGRIVAFEGYPMGWRGEPQPGAYYKIMIRPDFDRVALWRDLSRDIQNALGSTTFRFFDSETGRTIEP